MALGDSSDPVIQDIAIDPSITQVPTYNTSDDPGSGWSGLDELGSTTGNVASGILGAFGNLVAAQVNQSAKTIASGKGAHSTTNAKPSNPNTWKIAVGVGVAGLAVVVVMIAARRRG